MKFVFKRDDQYARCRPNRCGEQKGDKCDRSDDPRIMEGARTRPLRGARFHINPFRRSKPVSDKEWRHLADLNRRSIRWAASSHSPGEAQNAMVRCADVCFCNSD